MCVIFFKFKVLNRVYQPTTLTFTKKNTLTQIYTIGSKEFFSIQSKVSLTQDLLLSNYF